MSEPCGTCNGSKRIPGGHGDTDPCPACLYHPRRNQPVDHDTFQAIVGSVPVKVPTGKQVAKVDAAMARLEAGVPVRRESNAELHTKCVDRLKGFSIYAGTASFFLDNEVLVVISCSNTLESRESMLLACLALEGK